MPAHVLTAVYSDPINQSFGLDGYGGSSTQRVDFGTDAEHFAHASAVSVGPLYAVRFDSASDGNGSIPLKKGSSAMA